MIDNWTFGFLIGLACGMLVTWSHYKGRIDWGHSWWDMVVERLRGWW